jgi:hypothetical protein
MCKNSVVKERIIAWAPSPNITVKKKWHVRVIIVPDDMNWDAETYLLSPLPDDNKINCSLARNLSMHNIVLQMFLFGSPKSVSNKNYVRFSLGLQRLGQIDHCLILFLSSLPPLPHYTTFQ